MVSSKETTPAAYLASLPPDRRRVVADVADDDLPPDSDMPMQRRDVLRSAVASVATIGASAWIAPTGPQGKEMYGLIGKMTATPGQRDALIAILLQSTGEMPGCLSYVVATDATDADAIWITEAWDSQASHAASLSLPAVKDAIAKGRPLIAGFSDRVVTTPVGGVGLAAARAR